MADTWNADRDYTDTKIGAAVRYLTDAIRVQRMHACVNQLVKQTDGEHSAEVAMLCDLLTPGGASAVLLRAALRHDLAELVWGDIPAPAKLLIEQCGGAELLGAKEAETLADVNLAVGVHMLTPKEQRTLKMADSFSGALHCVYSRGLGAVRVASMFARYRQYIERMMPLTSPETAVYDQILKQWKEVHV